MQKLLTSPAVPTARLEPYRRQLPAMVSSLRTRILNGLPCSWIPCSMTARPYVAEISGLKDTCSRS